MIRIILTFLIITFATGIESHAADSMKPVGKITGTDLLSAIGEVIFLSPEPVGDNVRVKKKRLLDGRVTYVPAITGNGASPINEKVSTEKEE